MTSSGRRKRSGIQWPAQKTFTGVTRKTSLATQLPDWCPIQSNFYNHENLLQIMLNKGLIIFLAIIVNWFFEIESLGLHPENV